MKDEVKKGHRADIGFKEMSYEYAAKQVMIHLGPDGPKRNIQ